MILILPKIKNLLKKNINRKNRGNLNVVGLHSVRNKQTNRVFYAKKSDLDGYKKIQKNKDDYEISEKPVRFGIEVKYTVNGKTSTFLKRNKDKMYNVEPTLENLVIKSWGCSYNGKRNLVIIIA